MRFPKATQIRCSAESIPSQSLNGIERGIGSAVRSGAMSMKARVAFLFNLLNNLPTTEGLGAAIGALKQELGGRDASSGGLLQLASQTGRATGHGVRAPWQKLTMPGVAKPRHPSCRPPHQRPSQDDRPLHPAPPKQVPSGSSDIPCFSHLGRLAFQHCYAAP